MALTTKIKSVGMIAPPGMPPTAYQQQQQKNLQSPILKQIIGNLGLNFNDPSVQADLGMQRNLFGSPKSNFIPGTPTDPTVYQNWLNSPNARGFYPGGSSAGYRGYKGPSDKEPDWATKQIQRIQSGQWKAPGGVFGDSPGSIPQSSQPYRDPNNGLIVGSPEWMDLMQKTNPQDFLTQGPVTPLASLPPAPEPFNNFPTQFNYAGLPDPFGNYKI